MKLKNSNCVLTQQISIMIKIKNLNGDITQKLKWWQSSKTKIVTKLKKNHIVMKIKNLNYYESKKKVKL